eukprot:TRINITY_DN11502_c0_g1_i1.p1 TRINITY_DN11502_c0_g1~~TRINITY_DN11502_c0_g1_i1.p1  ORF type:complete len:708 (-),score=75.08 TRINITY_DN11502_c0_g1_i1:16-2139(-)
MATTPLPSPALLGASSSTNTNVSTPQNELIMWAQKGDLEHLRASVEQYLQYERGFYDDEDDDHDDDHHNHHHDGGGSLDLSGDKIGGIVNTTDDAGNSLLHWACYKKHRNLVKYLLSRRASVRVCSLGTGQTPLHWAAIGGDVQIVHMLRTAYPDVQEADPRYGDSMGYNVLHHAAMGGHIELLHWCVGMEGMRVDCTDTEGHTPIHWAAYKGKVMALRYLVQAGGDINLCDPLGRSAAHWASQAPKPDALKYLYEVGSSLVARDRDNFTPLDLARKKGTGRVVSYLADPKHWGSRDQKRKHKHLYLWKMLAVAIPIWTTYIVNSFTFPYAVFILASTISGAGYCVSYLSPMSPKSRNPFLLLFMITVYIMSGYIFYTSILLQIPSFSSSHPLLCFAFAALYILWTWSLYKLMTHEPGVVARAGSAAVQPWITSPGGSTKSYVKRDSDTDMDVRSHISVNAEKRDSRDTLYSSSSTQLFLEHIVLSDHGHPPTFCSTCLVVRPARGKHCSVCDQCVAMFDHHCGWINACVGAGNVRQFALFVFVMFTLLIMFVIVGVVALLQGAEGDDFWSLIDVHSYYANHPDIVVFVVLNGLLSAAVGNVGQGLLFNNILRGITLNEMINRHRYYYLYSWGFKHNNNPFHMGSKMNNVRYFISGDFSKWFRTYTLPTSGGGGGGARGHGHGHGHGHEHERHGHSHSHGGNNSNVV